MSSSSADFETTFDVDGHVETVAGLPPIDNQSVLLIFLILICKSLFQMIVQWFCFATATGVSVGGKAINFFQLF